MEQVLSVSDLLRSETTAAAATTPGVRHTGLEPRTSRPQAGRLLMRLSLALHRAGAAPCTDTARVRQTTRPSGSANPNPNPSPNPNATKR